MTSRQKWKLNQGKCSRVGVVQKPRTHTHPPHTHKPTQTKAALHSRGCPSQTCKLRSATRWRAQWSGESQWPGMMVEVVRRPTASD